MGIIETPKCGELLAIASGWRLTEWALIADANDDPLVLGRWDREFGAWRIDPKGRRPVILDVPLFDHLGRWPEPPGPRDQAWYQSRAAWAGYCALIPTPIRRLVAPLIRDQWRGLSLLRRRPQLARTLDDLEPVARRAWLSAVADSIHEG